MKYLPYSGRLELPGSKSILQRILLLASMQETVVSASPGSVCEDVAEMAEALQSLGGEVNLSAEKIFIDTRDGILRGDSEVYFSGSATTLRFWLARSIFNPGRTTVYISLQLQARALESFVKTLIQIGCGVGVSEREDEFYPHIIEVLSPDFLLKELEVNSDISSQFISGLMLSAAVMQREMRIRFKQNPVSYSYLELTAAVLKSFGAQVLLNRTECVIENSKLLQIPTGISVEPELSGGAFFMALSAFSQEGITLKNPAKTRLHPDWKILEILQMMGAQVTFTEEVVEVKALELKGIEIDMEDYPDLVPLVAILALFCDTTSFLHNISRLKYKESDRVKGILNAFKAIGAEHQYSDGTLMINPFDKSIGKVILDTQNDHRLVIAFTLLKLCFPSVELSETESVQKSCPEFFELLSTLKH